MTDLSPAAQAVLDAFLDSAVDAGNYYATRSHQIAAVLRAVAEQVAPHRPIPQNPMEWGEYNMTEIIRERLDTIATELEGQ
jgi:hypothetical protein